MRTHNLIAFALLLMAGGCQEAQSARMASTFTPGWLVLQDEDVKAMNVVEPPGPPLPEYVPVRRQWRDLPDSVFPFEAPGGKMVEKWKSLFEKANDADSVWFNDFRNFRGIDRWLAINDLAELSYGQRRASDKDDSRTLWRLLQFNFGLKEAPATKVEKVLHIREAVDTLLNYYPGSQSDLNLHACLENDLHEFYCRMMLKAITEAVPPDLRSALQREDQAWKKYYGQVSDGYSYLFDAPDGILGSGWPLFHGWYLEMHLLLRRVSLESLMLVLLDGDDSSSTEQASDYKVTSPMIAEEYEQFILGIDDEYGYPLAVQQKALDRDRKTWESWLSCRAAVSALLPSKEKFVYDRCTDVMRRYKLIMLKNRYENPDVYEDPESRGLIPFE